MGAVADEVIGLVGRVGGRYRVLGRIGRGGMGSVYRVLDESSGREVALKMLDHVSETSLALVEALFEREYRTLAQLDHPHVVQVFDYGVHSHDASAAPTPFYTMELLPGGDLRERLPLPWKQAAWVARDVCSALALLHSRRLLHRDVGIRNVRLHADGRAKLIDFGAMSAMGATHELIGTAPAVPPEVVRGQELDGRVDLYAVGALLYQALTGRHAYPVRRMRDLERAWRESLAPPSTIAPGVPPALDALVMALLAGDRTLRPTVAAEVIERLNAIAEHGASAELRRKRRAVEASFAHSRIAVRRCSWRSTTWTWPTMPRSPC